MVMMFSVCVCVCWDVLHHYHSRKCLLIIDLSVLCSCDGTLRSKAHCSSAVEDRTDQRGVLLEKRVRNWGRKIEMSSREQIGRNTTCSLQLQLTLLQ